MVLSLVCVGTFLTAFNVTIVNVAYRSIGESLGNSEHLPWIISGYNIAFAAALLTAGRMADSFGRKRALTSPSASRESSSDNGYSPNHATDHPPASDLTCSVPPSRSHQSLSSRWRSWNRIGGVCDRCALRAPARWRSSASSCSLSAPAPIRCPPSTSHSSGYVSLLPQMSRAWPMPWASTRRTFSSSSGSGMSGSTRRRATAQRESPQLLDGDGARYGVARHWNRRKYQRVVEGGALGIAAVDAVVGAVPGVSGYR
jgi:hypothetical protein